MKSMTMREKIDLLNYHTELYDQGRAIWSDKEWDELYFTLKQEEEEIGVIYPDSPTQKIHFEKVSELKKVRHNHPMLSLDKTKDFEDIKSFVKNHSWIAMAKMDGLTCSLKYSNGILVSAETRGNGIEGEDITHNARVIPSIPKRIPYSKVGDELVVDGEIICTHKDFEQFKGCYKNPRNFASGSIRLLDPEECKKRKLTFVAWDSFYNNDFYNIHNFTFKENLTSKLSMLKDLGFIIVPNVSDVEINLDKVVDFFKEEHTYPIDGIVFKYDYIDEYEAAGRTEHHFKGGLAYKFYDEEYETTVKDIIWTMGRSGQLTPVLIYEDLDIEGSVCNRASLHNITIMTKLLGGAYPGQKVYIYKANQIIPQVKFAQEDNPNKIKTIQIPKKCPYCGSPTEIKKEYDSEILYCTNNKCEGKLINRLEHFYGKKGLNIKGLSKATFQKLIDWGWINKIKDVFYLNQYREEWINKSGFGIKSVDKILNTIEENKKTTLEAFLSAIGIPLIGKAVAKDLAKQFTTYEDFRKAVDDNKYYFFELDNFGPEMHNSLKNFNYEEADRISKILILENTVVNNVIKKDILKGKTIVVTGKLANFKNRAELKEIIENLGGKVSSSISSKTAFLINNDLESNSTKNKEAKKLNIPIISEQDFITQYIDE